MKAILLLVICACANTLGVLLSLPSWARGRFAFRMHAGVMWILCPGMKSGGMTIAPNVVRVRALEFLNAGHTLAAHELVHVEQAQAASLLGAATTVVIWIEGRPWWGVLMPVTLAWLASAGAAYAVAWLRGEPAYEGSHIEEAARGAPHA